jgi:hypothetical protein
VGLFLSFAIVDSEISLALEQVEDNFVVSDDPTFNATGVRIYNYYPLDLDNPLFSKVGSYSEARIGENFATVLGFNETIKTIWMNHLMESSEIISESVWFNYTFNYVHFQFKSHPNIDFLMLPYLLVSSVEICNSSTWIDSNILSSRRNNIVLISDMLIRDFFGHFYTLSEYWLRPGDENFVTITSVEDIDPSIHELYELGGVLPYYIFDSLAYAYGTPTGLMPEIPYTHWEFEIETFPPFITYVQSWGYRGLSLVSHNDNPHMSGPYYHNEIFPAGHASLCSSLIWYNEVLLRYASNHIQELLAEIGDTFSHLDDIITSLPNLDFDAINESLQRLSVDIKFDLSIIRNQIFDFQDLLNNLNINLNRLNKSNQFIPFEIKFNDYFESISLNLDLATSRFESLKTDYDSTLSILSQLSSNQIAQDALEQNLLTFQSSSFFTFLGLIIAISSLVITNLHKMFRDWKINESNRESNMLEVAESLHLAFTSDKLRGILTQNGLSTKGRKRALAIRIVWNLGIEFVVDLLSNPPS